uniref:Asparagine--tRNA ligase n=1 Tax=uncultured Thermoplasmata archaeon TaxID=376542 RepID=A0A871XYR9_9ARCH|nr:Asparagine--tRNA ligase [uncultured Thermoplasmata archaeon]
MFNDISNVMSPDFDGKEVQIRGWIWRTRGSGKIVFPTVRDPSGVIQVTVKKGNVPDAQFEDALKALIESSVEITGTLKADDRAPGGFEIMATGFRTVSFAEAYPIQKDQSEEWLRENRHLWIRSRRMVAIMKIRHTVVGAIHQFFRENGYYEFDPPVLQPNQCEGGSTLFEVKFYDMTTYLSQTWQLYAEAGIFALGKIYDMAPTFRAEKSKTSRHLCEFWMAEMEAAWMELPEVTEVAKAEIKFIISEVLKNNRAELLFLERDISKLEVCLQKPFPTITYTEGLDMLKKDGMKVEWGKDLRTLEEEGIMKHFDTPVVVTHYPKEIMAFYKPVDPNAEAPGPVAKCFDMLAPEGGMEIVGGSERDTDIAELSKYLERDGENPANYQFYMDLRKYGSVPHSGYGVGVERLIQWICGLDNIKDAIAFPRTSTRITP